MTITMLVATVAAGLFAGASTYVTVAEHPAWLEVGPTLAVRHFGASARRAAIMQGGLAVVGLVSSAVAWFQGSGVGWLLGGLLLAVMVPFTLVIIVPINRRLLDPRLDGSSGEAADLLSRWGRLHAVRTAVGVTVFVMFVGMTLRS
jgi:anthrone oxygenase-like protein